MQLNQARVLLTGATGGLGNALARQLVRSGAQLLLTGRDAQKLLALQNELGAKASSVAADLNSDQGMAKLLDAAQEQGINVLINNAGVSSFGMFDKADWNTWEQVVNTNLLAPMRLTQVLLSQLKSQPQAAIVNVGSTFGSIPFAGFAAYSSAKAGLRGFSQSLRRELADTTVSVIHVAPRAISTPLNSPAVNALNHALGNASDSPERVATSILEALAGNTSERHIGFPERLFAWLNGVAPTVIDQGLRGKLATIKQHAQARP